jgi:2-phosphosulfolactate phosphatase
MQSENNQPLANLEVLFTPADYSTLSSRDLSNAVCVVFDILRATSSMVVALANGAAGIIPVASIADAVEWRRKTPNTLLAGERRGLRITAEQAGGVEFDLGNSPREFTPDRVKGRWIAMTTTNGTGAIRACAGAAEVLIGSFLNLDAMGGWIRRRSPERLLIVCGGTNEQAAFEDALAAGALCDLIGEGLRKGLLADSAQMAHQLYRLHQPDLAAAMQYSRNARRLLDHPDLRDDVACCLDRNRFDLVARAAGGRVVRA